MRIFQLEELYNVFSEFKKDRIDNQYYIPVIGTEPVNKEKCNERIRTAQAFNAKIAAYSDNLKIKEIDDIRKDFERI